MYHAESSIPKSLHAIWLGSAPPERSFSNVTAWMNKNPEYSMNIWIDSSTYPVLPLFMHEIMNKMVYECPKELLEHLFENTLNLNQYALDNAIDYVKSNDFLVYLKHKYDYDNFLKWSFENKIIIHDLYKGDVKDQEFFNNMLNKHNYMSEVVGECCNFAAASDILRIEILHKFGGVYFDICDRPPVKIKPKINTNLFNFYFPIYQIKGNDNYFFQNDLIISSAAVDDKSFVDIVRNRLFHNYEMYNSDSGYLTKNKNIISSKYDRRFKYISSFEINFQKSTINLSGPALLCDTIFSLYPKATYEQICKIFSCQRAVKLCENGLIVSSDFSWVYKKKVENFYISVFDELVDYFCEKSDFLRFFIINNKYKVMKCLTGDSNILNFKTFIGEIRCLINSLSDHCMRERLTKSLKKALSSENILANCKNILLNSRNLLKFADSNKICFEIISQHVLSKNKPTEIAVNNTTVVWSCIRPINTEKKLMGTLEYLLLKIEKETALISNYKKIIFEFYTFAYETFVNDVFKGTKNTNLINLKYYEITKKARIKKCLHLDYDFLINDLHAEFIKKSDDIQYINHVNKVCANTLKFSNIIDFNLRTLFSLMPKNICSIDAICESIERQILFRGYKHDKVENLTTLVRNFLLVDPNNVKTIISDVVEYEKLISNKITHGELKCSP